MLKDPSFAVFSFLAFALMVFATFYYFRASNFLPTVGISDSNLPLVLLVGQITEIPTMFILPMVLTRLGSKLTISIGLAAWAARFGIFSLGGPAWLMVAAQGLHGIAFAFAIAAAMIYVERICSPDVRGSMQSFLSWLTYGLGMFVGGIVGGKVSDMYTVGKATDWKQILMVPAVGCAVVMVLFVIAFRARDTQPAATPAAAGN
jgi:MFS family permease